MTVIPLSRPILILEDDALLALGLEETLREAGFAEVVAAFDVAEALLLIERLNPAAAVLDYDIGRGTSEPVARRLMERGVPVIFVTGAPDLARAVSPQALILAKPACEIALTNAVARLSAAA